MSGRFCSLFSRAPQFLIGAGFLLITSVLCALFIYEPAVGAESDNRLEALVSGAQAAHREGRFGDAVRLYTQATALAPSEASTYLGRGTAYEMLDLVDKAVGDYEKALEFDPGNYRAMENLAGIYERGGKKIRDALELYKKALDLDPRPVWKENLAVWIAMLQYRLKKANSSAVGLWNRGNEAARKGRLDEAESLYSEAIAVDPLMYQAFFSRGLNRIKSNDPTGAASDFDQGVSLDPGFPGGLVLMGLAYEKMGRAEKALEIFLRSTEMEPQNPEAFFHLGRMLENSNQRERALHSYQQALRLKPKPDLMKLLVERLDAARISAQSPEKKGRARSGEPNRPW